MAYADKDDIVALYGQAALVVADHQRIGVPSDVAITRALELASDEIDSFVGVRFPLPLRATPGILTQYCVDIALYRLALSADVLSTEHRTRYDDAIAALTRISVGKATLVIPPDPDNPDNDDIDGDGIADGPRPIVATGPERLFSREKTRDF